MTAIGVCAVPGGHPPRSALVWLRRIPPTKRRPEVGAQVCASATPGPGAHAGRPRLAALSGRVCAAVGSRRPRGAGLSPGPFRANRSWVCSSAASRGGGGVRAVGDVNNSAGGGGGAGRSTAAAADRTH